MDGSIQVDEQLIRRGAPYLGQGAASQVAVAARLIETPFKGVFSLLRHFKLSLTSQ
jgi:hypothetical protein